MALSVQIGGGGDCLSRVLSFGRVHFGGGWPAVGNHTTRTLNHTTQEITQHWRIAQHVQTWAVVPPQEITQQAHLITQQGKSYNTGEDAARASEFRNVAFINGFEAIF